MVQFKQIPAFQDNYIWMLCVGKHAWVVDPGDADPVIGVLQAEHLSLRGILVTHHHNDHVGGIEKLIDFAAAQGSKCAVIGPLHEDIPYRNQAMIEGDVVELFEKIVVQVLELPGHTKGHIAYFLPQSEQNETPRVFCGDTLFASGCGRLFEGTAKQMSESLAKLAVLPKTTLVCCAHEYTLSNLRFAQAVEKDNEILDQWVKRALQLREKNLPTVPTTMAHELLVNPFLRCSQASVVSAACDFAGKKLENAVEVFTALRLWKDGFK